ncbi:MAG: hypothetical protein J2P48_08330 [Alphaproteobacteria bacterium]|nr:hypothetical protein [Alphaproteobacteria bacterium]
MKGVHYDGTGMVWVIADGHEPEELGLVPSFFAADDPRPAREQIAERYISGWTPMPGFKIGKESELLYPGDPPLKPIAVALLRGLEVLVFYEYSWLAIIQHDGSFEVSRVD